MGPLREVPERVSAGSPNSISDMSKYHQMYDHALDDLNEFWLGVAREKITWRREPSIGLKGSFAEIPEGPLSWFSDGRLNVTESCLDSNLATRGDKVAILWEGDEPDEET